MWSHNVKLKFFATVHHVRKLIQLHGTFQTEDEALALQCVFGYATSFYLVMDCAYSLTYVVRSYILKLSGSEN